jgi:hypothetical protein
MTLKQLISQQSWLNIEAALLNEYPNEQHNLSCYEAIYHQLLLLPEIDTDLQIVLRHIQEPDANGNTVNYVDVCGKKQTPHIADADLQLYYSLRFTTWAEWLAMPVSPKTLWYFAEAEIVAHCLREMTSHSFDENVIQDEKARLSVVVSDTDHIYDKGHWYSLISWEQIVTQLNKE